MGVPKFYRWISQRYPCINQIIRETEVVPIDHLYLDMNGIIHSSSHSENSAFIAYDESNVFQTISEYVQYIIWMMKPRKTVFIAVDGVAPRAKMTQQRARRFQGPKEVSAETKRRKEKGIEIDEKSLFDANCISPGTEFMDRLHAYLKQFIAEQLTTDRLWRRIDVIYSGHDAPGEGEQKIREYMSHQRGLPDYRPTERHCLYGMDADLIFLGLATHEPNLCILRENVYTVKSPKPQDVPFVLVHLSILREYISLELQSLKSQISFPYNFERIIDDWIFLGYLLGNDFIPHLPNMHIHAESLTTLWDAYHVVLPQLDGYLHDFGVLNIDRLHVFLSEIAKFDMTWFEDREADQRWMQGKHGSRMAQELERLGRENITDADASAVADEPLVSFFDSTEVPVDHNLEDVNLGKLDFSGTGRNIIDEELVDLFGSITTADTPENKNATKILAESSPSSKENLLAEEKVGVAEVGWHHPNGRLPSPSHSNNIGGGGGFGSVEDDEDLLAYRMHRQNYYATKLKIDIRGTSSGPASEDFVESALLPICREYVKTLQWVLHYYFTSVADWKHYYPYHYAPFASDLLIFTKRFVEGGVECRNQNNGIGGGRSTDWADFMPNTKPLLPFEQQMFIMPPSSADILPPPYRWLFASSGTPVAQFFPDDFETDINGKQASWEAVVLLPFIDEIKMLAAMAPATRHLSPEDSRRNVHRGHLIMRVAGTDRSSASPSATFDSLLSQEVDGEFFRARVLRDHQQCAHVYCDLPRSTDPNYPSFSRLPFQFEVRRIGVQTFSFPSKLESLMLTVNHPSGRGRPGVSSCGLEEIAGRYLGHAVVTGWPYVRYVTPMILLDEREIWEVDLEAGPQPDGTPRIINRTCLRAMDDADPSKPFWASVRWLQSQAEWTINRLKDRCAVTLEAKQPRAALICLPVGGSTFTVDISNQETGVPKGHLRLRPLCTRPAAVAKRPIEHQSSHRRGGGGGGGGGGGADAGSASNKQCIRGDADLSVRLGTELSLEILDLTLDVSGVCFERSFADAFLLGSCVGVFSKSEASRDAFGRFGEVTGFTDDGKISVQLFPAPPLSRDPYDLADTILEADDSSYLLVAEISRELHLTQHVITRIVGDVMVRIPPPPPEFVKKGRDRVSRDWQERRNLANIGFNIVMMRNFAGVVGWSRFSNSRNAWVYSRRVLETLEKYYEKFPEVFNFIGTWDPQIGPVDLNAIFPTDTFNHFIELRTFLRTEVKQNRTVTDANAALLDKAGFLVLDQMLLPKVSEPTKSDKRVIEVAANEVFTMMPEGARLIPHEYVAWLKSFTRPKKELDKFNLFDRVVYAGPKQSIVGLGGVIVGVYPILREEIIEVAFDREFDGAISIRGSSHRCSVVTATHLLHLPLYTTAPSSVATKHAPVTRLKQSDGCRPAVIATAAALSPADGRRQPGAHSRVVKSQTRPKQPPEIANGLLPPEWLETPPVNFATPISCEPKTPQELLPSKAWPGRQKKPATDGGGHNSAVAMKTSAASCGGGYSQQKSALPPRFRSEECQKIRSSSDPYYGAVASSPDGNYGDTPARFKAPKAPSSNLFPSQRQQVVANQTYTRQAIPRQKNHRKRPNRRRETIVFPTARHETSSDHSNSRMNRPNLMDVAVAKPPQRHQQQQQPPPPPQYYPNDNNNYYQPMQQFMQSAPRHCSMPPASAFNNGQHLHGPMYQLTCPAPPMPPVMPPVTWLQNVGDYQLVQQPEHQQQLPGFPQPPAPVFWDHRQVMDNAPAGPSPGLSHDQIMEHLQRSAMHQCSYSGYQDGLGPASMTPQDLIQRSAMEQQQQPPQYHGYQDQPLTNMLGMMQQQAIAPQVSHQQFSAPLEFQGGFYFPVDESMQPQQPWLSHQDVSGSCEAFRRAPAPSQPPVAPMLVPTQVKKKSLAPPRKH